MGSARSWAWTARRIAISAFVIGHLTATAIWITPRCPIRNRCYETLSYYMLPTGLWQYWNMFAPDPQGDSFTLEAEVKDVDGVRHRYAFTRIADYSWIAAIPKFRHPKFASNLGFDELEMNRKITSRYAVRELGLPPEAFPLDVELYFMCKVTPVPGGPPADGMLPPRPQHVANYHFSGHDEVFR
jgi:hypothetical protein